MKRCISAAVITLFTTTTGNTATTYEIQAAVNDELFIINGEKFQAKTYCLGWDEGEEVIFIDGRASGICVSAELFNVNREETCRVWCE
ncbi:hypothetical protein [Sinorhizobium meliloti]|uniref:hypothetical protein n=1 Tax=Rhizobium meliloti TaxID=382 RepID=UPI00299EDE73|nr:hypothetical protein [Sinorhizobium meliloti]